MEILASRGSRPISICTYLCIFAQCCRQHGIALGCSTGWMIDLSSPYAPLSVCLSIGLSIYLSVLQPCIRTSSTDSLSVLFCWQVSVKTTYMLLFLRLPLIHEDEKSKATGGLLHIDSCFPAADQLCKPQPFSRRSNIVGIQVGGSRGKGYRKTLANVKRSPFLATNSH